MSSAPPALPSWQRVNTAWLPPTLVGAALFGGLVAADVDDLASARALAFIGGPTLLLAGIHDRLTGYLHAAERQRLSPLPLPPFRHFAAARRHHAARFLLTAIIGVAAVGLAHAGTRFGAALHRELILQWLWLLAFAFPCELLGAGLSAYLGRRFGAESPAHRVQGLLTGGWTAREAAVHLYAPALTIGAAVLLSLPGQLSLARATDGLAVHQPLVVASTLPLVPLVLAPWIARLAYARGFWEAVAWLHETVKTIAGPPRPEHAPGWLSRVSWPVTRLFLLRVLRLTPFASTRFLVLLTIGVYLLVRNAAPTIPSAIVFALLLFAWVLPVQTLVGSRDELAPFLAALPLPERQRHGVDRRFQLLTLGPPLMLFAGLCLRWSLS